MGKLIVLSLDESERTIYDKIMKIVGEADIYVDKTLLREQKPMRIGELCIQPDQHSCPSSQRVSSRSKGHGLRGTI